MSDPHEKPRRKILFRSASASLALGLALATAGTASGQTALPAPDHCVSPVFGLDLNTFYDVPEQIVAPGCSHINVGPHYRVWAGAWMNTTFAAVPPDFVPIGSDPLEDFIAKLVAVTYVVDSGTHGAPRGTTISHSARNASATVESIGRRLHALTRTRYH